MRIKANGSTRKKHRMLRPRFLIVKVAAIERADSPQRMLHAVLNQMKCEAKQRAEKRTREAVANARSLQRLQLTEHGRDQF